MMASTLKSASSLALAGFLLFAYAQAPEEPLGNVTKLRTEKITFYTEGGEKSGGEFARSDFNKPWPITKKGGNGLLQVIVDGQHRWVRTVAVETDRRVETNQDCGIVVLGREHKQGVTRGLGEGCNKEPKK